LRAALFQFMWLGRSIGWNTALSSSKSHYSARCNVALKRSYLRMASHSSTPLNQNNVIPCNNNRPLVVIIAGSTGVGKSDVAALLCERHKGLVVSADSVQAYRHVQIGANKPSQEELLKTPHLLIDVADSSDSYNAAEWMDDVLYVIQKLHQQEATRQNDQQRSTIDKAIQQAKEIKQYSTEEPIIPVIVGGTMMYLQWLVHGKPDAPSPTPNALAKAKETIQRYESEQDWTDAVTQALSLHESLQAPLEKLFANDWYRLRRILEVAYTVQEQQDNMAPTGDKVDDLSKYYSGERSGGLLSLNYDVRCFFLCPSDRMRHTRTVDDRCEQMLLQGLVPETCDLALSKQLPDMAAKAIGYRQVLDYLGREGPKDNDYDAFLEFLEDFTTATRQYSRRQVQWFRKDEQFVFVSVDVTREKRDRVLETATEIERMLALSRDDFDAERLANDGSSAETRRKHDEQGKGMRTYMFKHHFLTPGSPELDKVLKEADECTHRFQAKRIKSFAADN
jgi:tRNA dimethylallyltransferase